MDQQFWLALNNFIYSLQSWFAALEFLDLLMILAGLLGLAAVYMFHRSDRTVRYQVDQERAERASEREMALRKEVYLPAAEAIGRAQDFLAKYPAMDLAREQAQDVVDQVLGALGKAQLVASEASLQPVMAVTSEFSNSYVALVAKLQPLHKLRAEIAELSSAVEHLAVERDHLLAQLTRLAADNDKEQLDTWRSMSKRFDKLHREIGSLLGKRKDRAAQLAVLEHEFAVEAQQSALRLAKLGVPAFLALRDELRLDIDEAQYRATAQRHIDEIERSIQTLAEPKKERPVLRRPANPQPRREPVIAPLEAVGGQLKVALKRSG